jgi:hypothetical protein
MPPTQSPQTSGWVQAVAPADGFGLRLNDVAPVRAQVVAVGYTEETAGSWLSDDGENWRLGGLTSDIGRPAFRAIAANGHTIVALAASVETGVTRSTFWQSQDGASWAGMPGVPDDLADVELVTLSWTESTGFIAGGYRPLATTETARTVPIVQFVGDEWARVELPASLDAASSVRTITVLNGVLIAAGGEDGAGESAVWSSTDGHDWTLRKAFPGALLKTSATAGDGLVVAGCAAAGDVARAAVWSTSDLQVWRQEAIDSPPSDRSCVFDLATGPSDVRATGAFGSTLGAWRRGESRWTMIDEAREVAPGREVVGYGIAATDAGFVIVGGDAGLIDPSSDTGAAWWWR